MATYFTKGEARTAAQIATLAKSLFAKSSAQILKEDRQAIGDSESFDVFLSHSISDAELVLGVKRLLEARGLKVYVDWDTDAHLDRRTVSSETAELLRFRMRQSTSLIYLATDSATTSRWMPWELGYFDGLRNGLVAVMPLTDNENDKFSGQEYLGLYPMVTKDTYQNTTQKDVFVEGQGRWTTLREFNEGKLNWRAYATSAK